MLTAKQGLEAGNRSCPLNSKLVVRKDPDSIRAVFEDGSHLSSPRGRFFHHPILQRWQSRLNMLKELGKALQGQVGECSVWATFSMPLFLHGISGFCRSVIEPAEWNLSAGLTPSSQ